MVTDAVSVTARPLSVVVTALGGGPPPVVEKVMEASDNIVPTMVEPVPIVAPAGRYQNTFLACAPFTSRTWTETAGVAGPVTPTVSVPVPAAVWKIHKALPLPPASSVRLPAFARVAPML